MVPNRTSQVVLVFKNLLSNAGDTREESLIPGLGRSPLVGNEIHSNILDWKILWTEEPGGLQSMVYQSWTHTHTHTSLIGFKGGESWPRLQPSFCGRIWEIMVLQSQKKEKQEFGEVMLLNKQKTHWVMKTVQILTQHHTVGPPYWLSILYIVVHVYSSQWKSFL